MLDPTAATATTTAATSSSAALLPRHPQQAAGHGELGCLGEVGEDAPRRAGETPLHGGLRLGSLREQRVRKSVTSRYVGPTKMVLVT